MKNSESKEKQPRALDEVFESKERPKIALITPACGHKQMGGNIEQSAQRVKAMGFDVVFDPNSDSELYPFRHSDIANTAEARALQIINFAQDPNISAMWAINGGESGPEVAKLLVDYGNDPKKYIEKHQIDPLSGQRLEYIHGTENGFPKDRPLPAIVGMSDVSSIQIALSKFGFPSIYGNVAGVSEDVTRRVSAAMKSDDSYKTEFEGLILAEKEGSREDTREVISGPVYATVTGGLFASLNTPWQPKFAPNTVLMVEDVSGYEVLSKRLRAAKEAGALKNVQAILVGKASGVGGKAEEGLPKELQDLAKDLDQPLFLIPGNQFGHLHAGQEPTPIMNFGNITIDVGGNKAIITKKGQLENSRSYQQQGSILRQDLEERIFDRKQEKKSEPTSYTAFKQDSELELSPLNNSASKHGRLTQINDVVVVDPNSISNQKDLKGKTLLITGGSWVGIGRDLTDLYNKGILSEASGIIVGIDDNQVKFQERIKQATTTLEKAAIGLSFATTPDFEYHPDEKGRLVFDSSFLQGEDPEVIGNNWIKGMLKKHDITPENIEIEGRNIILTIKEGDIEKLSQKSQDLDLIKETENRVSYLAKRYLDKDPKTGENQAGDRVEREIPVFMVDKQKIPKTLKIAAKEGDVLVEQLGIRVQGTSLEAENSWVKKLDLEDKAEKPRSFLEAAQAGKYGNIGSKGGAHEL
jgi:muramoyltetrapeptide carboxypeptidase LdcA involved in peptidoglycan recycling